MAKRFTDTSIWEKSWFMKLKPKHKCLIKYLYDKCDPSGVYEPNWELVSMCIKEKVNVQDLEAVKNQIEVLPGGKIFIPDFINFQYGKLSEASPAHKPIFQAILKNNLSDRVFNRVSTTLQEKETDKEKEEVEEKEKEGVQGEAKKFNKPTVTELDVYMQSLGAKSSGQDIYDHYESNGWKVGKVAMKDWQAACRNWKKNEDKFNKNGKGNNHATDRVSRSEDISNLRQAIRTLPIDGN